MQIHLHFVRPQYVQNEFAKLIGSLPRNSAAQYPPGVVTAAALNFYGHGSQRFVKIVVWLNTEKFAET